jgi:drug/metabolite transporter (DMT)-like permease
MSSRRQTPGLTLLALVAFAANSIFCRLALHTGAIDAMSFTSVRLLSGALMLALLLYLRSRHQNTLTRQMFNPLPAICLFGYAMLFSWAYTLLDTGTGALILFGTVQLTMIGRSLLGGSHLTRLECGGSAMAISGLTYLLLPGVSAPSLPAAGAMALAGIAWGGYTLLGKASKDALAGSAVNFMLTLPLALLISLLDITDTHISTAGISYAVASGALASGCGYAIWYQVLPRLGTTTAATVQLSVPMLAAFGGTLFLSETISDRLLIASCLTLGGIALVIRAASARAKQRISGTDPATAPQPEPQTKQATPRGGL